MCNYQDYIDADVFKNLSKIDITDYTEKRNGFSYVSWVFAWNELKKQFPDANIIVYENKDGWNYHTDGKTAWVKVGVVVKGLEQIEYLPVMDYRNKSIPLDSVTSFDVTKAIQRCATKCIARHGLGLRVYSKEDLPEDHSEDYAPVSAPKQTVKTTTVTKPIEPLICADCKGEIKEHQGVSASKIAEATKKKYGVPICMECSAKRRAKAEEPPKPEPQPEPIIDEDGVELPFNL